MKLRSTTAWLATAGLLAACTITPPPVSVSPNDPSNPEARESISGPLRPGLVAGAQTYLSPRTGADAQEMSHGGHDMSQMQNNEMPDKPGAPQNEAEAKVAAELQHEPSPAAPTSEQLQSIHPSDYTCPMHPEIHSKKPGRCPKCGMTLVSRESLEKHETREPTP